VIEEHLKLLGDVAGKRVLELGFRMSSSAIELASKGALVIGVDASASRVAAVKQVAEQEGVKVDVRAGDLAELAFVRADTVDAAVSDHGLDDVPDIDRVFRQVHRVLRSDGLLLFTLPHPAAGDASYFAGRTIGALFASLTRANFRIDTLLEPEPHLIVRARKLGS
jgi:ubiquinone/menaquinone biosynthesis C-methylase UbiE